VVGLALLAWPARAAAQSPESEAAPPRGSFEPGTIPAPDKPFIVPDVPASVESSTQVRSHWFTLKPGLVLLFDYSAIGQDDRSEADVGPIESQFDVRSARAMLRGTLGSGYKVNYLVAGEYRGFETSPDTDWNMTDVSLTFPLGTEYVKLTAGKTKETFGYEMVGDAANLPQQERVLTPFFVSRSIGVKLLAVLGKDHRMTLGGGVFDDSWTNPDELSQSGTDVTLRFTGLLRDADDGRSFLHFGVAARYAGADDGSLRFRGRPASNVTPNFVDTDPIPGDYSMNVGLEALWNEGPFSLLAEYNQAWLVGTTFDAPAFNGFYVTGSWVISGETRKYDRTVGYARRVMPTKHWGAPEVVARYGRVDLNDAGITGGAFDLVALGVNWWATRRAKLGINWQHIWLDRFATGERGNTDILLMRVQWVY
jgi:phosphate-selective porin OprO/OprP